MTATIRIIHPTQAALAAMAARWATRDGDGESETTVVISNTEPDRFIIWTGRGPDVRAILRRADGRLLEVSEEPHGCRFVFPRSALRGAGVSALLKSEARSEASRGRRPGFASSLTGSTDADADVAD